MEEDVPRVRRGPRGVRGARLWGSGIVRGPGAWGCSGEALEFCGWRCCSSWSPGEGGTPYSRSEDLSPGLSLWQRPDRLDLPRGREGGCLAGRPSTAHSRHLEATSQSIVILPGPQTPAHLSWGCTPPPAVAAVPSSPSWKPSASPCPVHFLLPIACPALGQAPHRLSPLLGLLAALLQGHSGLVSMACSVTGPQLRCMETGQAPRAVSVARARSPAGRDHLASHGGGERARVARPGSSAPVLASWLQ